MTPFPKSPSTHVRNRIAIIVLMALALSWRTLPTRAADTPPTNNLLLRVNAPTDADAQRLLATGVDVQEARAGADLFVIGDSQVQAQLQSQGFTVSIEQEASAQLNAPETYYLGYRTVAEHFAHLDAIAATYPNLATVYDIGDGWRKTNGRTNGQDLKAICITHKRLNREDCALNPNTDKPRFLISAATHARELSTAEVAWRWIDYLVTQYNVDPDITALLDDNEMWVIPLHNPEGRTIVESGGNAPYLQRKNTNNTMGNCAVPPTGANQHGVDLNRNASWDWGGVGTSPDPCSSVYLGTGPASEPENKAVEALFAQLFRDQRAPDLTSPAPITTTGLFITLHSWGNLVLVPWATDGAAAPNDAALRALGFRMSYFNGYIAGRGKEVLYSTSGSTDDQTYGVYGIPSFTYELGGGSGACGGFLPAYSCQDSLFWPANRGALIYAAKSARAGYATGSGPSTVNVAFAISRTVTGGNLTLNALIDDNRYGSASGSVGRPFVHAIKSAEVYIDVPPWAGGTPIAMSAVDGAFSATAENVRATLNTQGLALGRHTVYVRGSDSSNTFGPTTAQWFWVDAATPTPTPSPSPTPDPAGDVCAPVSVTANLAIPDNRAAPTCVDIPVAANGKVTNAMLKLVMAHTYVGDLRVQLISPSGVTLTVLNRPGVPATQYGDSSNFVASAPITFASAAPYNPELMGNTLLNAQAVCRDDKRCTFTPNPDGDLASVINNFTGFSGQSSSGTWRLCIADLSNRDVGTINAATLDLACVAPSVQLLPVTPEPTSTPEPTPTPAVLAPDKPDDELPATIWLPVLVAE